jgi:hypothetical protein
LSTWVRIAQPCNMHVVSSQLRMLGKRVTLLKRLRFVYSPTTLGGPIGQY